MGRSCTECLRILLVIYNFILVLIGLEILGFAVYAYIEPVAQHLIEASNRRLVTTVVLFVLMGIATLTLVVALFGCCGAYHESPCLLSTYFIFLIIIFIIQVSGAAAGYYYREEIFAETEKKMQDGVFDYMKPVDAMGARPLFMKSVQKVFECCGVRGPGDYGDRVPITCCITSQSSCNAMDLRPEEVFQDGCIDKYKKMSITVLQIIFLVIFGISVFELLGLLLSIIMWCIVRKYTADYNQVNYAVSS